MKIKYLLFALVLISAACQPKKQGEQTAADSTAMSSDETNTSTQLTDEQKAEGWKLLFDGQSLNGWRFFKNAPNDSWEVKDGTLHCKPFVDGKENKRSDIMTTDQYENFELSMDWKISAQGNSGIIYRATEAYDQPYLTGPEYQVLDDGGYPGETKDKNMTACAYDMYEAPGKKLNPVGEWNTSKIVVKGNQVEHWLNGDKVVSYEIGSAEWTKRKAISKWKDEAGYGMAKKGHIDLQDHNHEAWFKNIMIKPL
jgi:hypothetical protein